MFYKMAFCSLYFRELNSQNLGTEDVACHPAGKSIESFIL